LNFELGQIILCYDYNNYALIRLNDIGVKKFQVYFESDEVHACIVTCGGLCPGLNTVIREIVCGLLHMYGVTKVFGIEVSYIDFISFFIV
jgi:hypothetical protein